MTRRSAGFTLIEMLVAMGIFLIFVSAVYGIYAGAATAMARAEAHQAVYQTGRVLLAQVSAELASAYPQPGEMIGFVGEDNVGMDAEYATDQVTFLTTAHAMNDDAPAGDLLQVRYRMADTAVGEEPGLYIQVNRAPGLEVNDTEVEPETRRLSARVMGFNARYLPADGDWLAEWPDGATLPRAVRVELTLRSDEDSAAPVVLSTTTNLAMATAEAATGEEGADATP
ncbi:MAG: Pseudopilin GspJ [bacterium ADurb.Bin429]|nr:MAG: Pseudopilin GspJ [bacterium ADurb.Bin429]